jgi:hypothetical protein
MPRLFWLGIVLLFCLSNAGCAAVGTAAGLYALSQTDFVQDKILD